MKVKFRLGQEGGSITVTREKSDRKYYGHVHASGEHSLFRCIAKYLNARGFNLIKIRAQKDGHMLGDEYQPYLRPPKRGKKPCLIYIYSGFYALRGANEDWNHGEVDLMVTCSRDDKPDWRDAVVAAGAAHDFPVELF